MNELHARIYLLRALEVAFDKAGILLLPEMEVVKPTDLPCAVIEEVQEQVTPFDDTLARRATKIDRRIRFAVLVLGRTKVDRDDTSLAVEKTVVPALVGADFERCGIAGVGFAQAKVGAEVRAFVASTFYEVVYSSPTYRP